MGSSVNLAARLMCSRMNRGVLVDESIHRMASMSNRFKALEPMHAKGYPQHVHIYEPLRDTEQLDISSADHHDINDINKTVQHIDLLDSNSRNVLFVASVIGIHFTNQTITSVFQQTTDLKDHDLHVQVEIALAIVVECSCNAFLEQKQMTQVVNDKSSNPIFTFSTSEWRAALLSLMLESKKRLIEQVLKNSKNEFHPERNMKQTTSIVPVAENDDTILVCP
jgi:hypothetical protein